MEMNDISNLASLLRENGDKVINGQSKLSLTVNLLKSLNEAFALIVESDEVCNSSFQVIDINCSKVDTFHDIQFLHDFVQKTVSLKLTNSVVPNDSFKGTVTISKFKGLRYLELRKIPLNVLNGIQSIRNQLQSIVCIRCIKKLEDIIFDCGADHSSGFVWSDLQEAVFSYNGIDILDESLRFTPWLQILDLSHNRITQADAIELLPNLKYLNLSYNLLESIPSVHREACRKLQVLVIKNNYIEVLSGLLGLEGLLELDLSCNCLSHHESLNPLLYLSALTWLSLEGNPLSFHPQHRIRTVSHLHNSTATNKFMLDRFPLSKSERLAVGSASGVNICRTSLKDDASSAGSSSASERTLVAEKGHSKVQPNHGNKRISKVREAVISEQESEMEISTELSSSVMTSSIDLSTDHLETKKQIETIRERYGEDNWLHRYAGSCVQDVLGLHKTASVPSVSSPSKSASIINDQKTKTESVLQSSSTSKLSAEQTPEKFNNMKQIQVLTSQEESKEIPKDIMPEETFQTKEEDEEEEDEDEEEEVLEEEEDEGEQQLYLVQRHRPGVQASLECFLVITERWLKEREALSGKTLEKWAMESLLSCVKAGREESTVTVHLTFDSIRRDRQERFYGMEEDDAQRIIRTLNEVLESRPLTLNQIAFRCMKCSTQFSQEKTPVMEKNPLKCPTCNSTLVIEMDEVPLPSHQKDSQGEKNKITTENGSSSSGLNSSPSQCSIGSAASLDPYSDSPNNSGGPVRRWDSDIEIISNPSQSSIEILDEQTRLQGSGTPSRKKSSEERQIVSVVVPVPHSIEENNHLVSLTGLTESSSSGSLTDSICTTYEIHSSSLPSRQGLLIPRVEEVDEKDTNNENSSMGKNINGGRDLQSNKPENMTSDYFTEQEDIETDDNSTSLFKTPGKTLSPQTNYAIMLEGLLQNVGSKMDSKYSATFVESQDKKDTGLCNNRVNYSYTDFSVVDHRVKLYLYLHIFQQEQEELSFLIRAHIMNHNLTTSFPGLFVASTKYVYILQVTGEEGDDPEQWLHKIESFSIEKMLEIFPLPWHQGIGIDMQGEGGGSYTHLLILQDQVYTTNLIAFLAGLTFSKQFSVKNNIRESQILAIQQILLSSISGEEIDTNICLCSICSSCIVKRNEESSELDMGTIVITPTDLVMTDNMEWLVSTQHVLQKNCFTQKMSNLIEVGMESIYQLILNFLDDVAGIDETWTLTFGTESSLQSTISAIKVPWEKLFCVPLTIMDKSSMQL